MIDDPLDFHRHFEVDELVLHELPDGVSTPDLPPVVVDISVSSEGPHDAVGVVGVDRVDVFSDDRWQFGDDLAG